MNCRRRHSVTSRTHADCASSNELNVPAWAALLFIGNGLVTHGSHNPVDGKMPAKLTWKKYCAVRELRTLQLLSAHQAKPIAIPVIEFRSQ